MANYTDLLDLLSDSYLNSKNGSKIPNDRLIFENTPQPLNVFAQGMYSTEINALTSTTITQLAYPSGESRPSIKELTDMVERDPVASKCVALKALRAVSSFGKYTHPKKEIESFVNSNIETLSKSFKQTLFKIISNTILYGFCVIEVTFSSKIRGYRGQWRLARFNVLDPSKINSFCGKGGKVDYIEYDNGNGNIIKIPYKKCLHLINNSGITFNEKELFGVGDGIAANNYYKLKRVVLTQLALATKNNSTGIIHAKTPNSGRTLLVDSKMQPLKDNTGKPIEVTKQLALHYQLQDLYKKDFVVTDIDVEINRIQVQNDERFWEYVLNYLDRAIQMSFGVPVGIFDSGMNGMQNVGLSQNYKSVFDSTIFALTTLLKEELTKKVIKKLLYFNFPFEWFKNNYGEFIFDVEEDQNIINSRLSTISSLIASGILDMNDVEVLGLIRKNLGLPALTETDKNDKQNDEINKRIQKEVQSQLELLQIQNQIKQTQLSDIQVQQQAQMLTDPAMQQQAMQQQQTEDYPANA